MLGFSAVSEAPISALLTAQVTVTETLVTRFASRSMVTRATDAPAHTYIPGRIMRGLTLGRRLVGADDGQFGALIESNFGDIELANADGFLDSLVNEYFTDGQRIVLKIGATEINATNGREQPQAYANFATVYTSVAGEWTFEHDVVRLRISSLQNRLSDRFQVLTYAGTGGQNGSAELVGRTLPTALGQCSNVPAQIVDPAILTYQLHAGSMNQVTTVYDGGISVPFAADYPSYSALAAATIPVGRYATCLAEGFIRLAVAPAGTVTADVRGDIDSVNGSYVSHHATVLRMVLRDYGGLASSELDLDSFIALDALNSATMGLFLPAGDQSTVVDVAERIAFSCGAFAGQDRSGLYRVQRLDAPAAQPHWTFTDRSIVAIEREPLPYRVPWYAWGVGYARNWTVQSGADLFAGVAQERRQFLESEYRYAYAQSPTIAQAHLTSAGAPPRQALFVNQADAAAEATRLIGLYGLGRAIYAVDVKTALFSVEIGQTVRLVYNRWDLAEGKNFVVLAIEDDANATLTSLRVFG